MANFEFQPCPFCGGHAIAEDAGEKGYRVVCSGCGARLFWKRALNFPVIDPANSQETGERKASQVD